MILRIGLDFDNTIANYDRAFPDVARELGFKTTASNKRDLKAELLKSQDGESAWQKVQGMTYGKYIGLATLHPGVLEFIVRAKARRCEVFVVSHKTEFGHFDDLQTPLRQAATDWLIKQCIVEDSSRLISKSNIFYLSTRGEKIQKIIELDLDIFVDDLREVLVEPEFPNKTRKVLFAAEQSRPRTGESEITHLQSWREIGDDLFGVLEPAEVLCGIQHICPNLGCHKAEPVEGRGNSKIFKLATAIGDVALKVYPDSVADNRPRRETEWLALSFLNANKMQTPVPVLTDQNLNWSLLEWVHGESARLDIERHIYKAVDFVRGLNETSKSTERNVNFSPATEACLRPDLVEQQINSRLDALKKVNDSDLQNFLTRQLEPAYEKSLAQSKSLLGAKYANTLESAFWTLSPSDFGLHNAIVTPVGDLVFFDFEYFGWDDPVKLTADFCHHPGMGLSRHEQHLWITEMTKVFSSDPNFAIRLEALYPLYAIRWALIILNEFRTDKIKNRLHARSRIQADIKGTQIMQLEKAKLMIKNLERLIL